MPTVSEPMEPFTEAEIIEKARGVITGAYLMADIRDHDWQHSLALLVSGWEDPPENVSTLFLVPLAPHANGRWLNGRVPGVTTSAECVPIESVQPLLDQIQTFWHAINPDVAPAPQSGP
jgi:hypothetical protein